MVVFSNEVCSTFTVMSSRTLLSVHVYPTGLPIVLTSFVFFLDQLIVCTYKLAAAAPFQLIILI